ncbi:MAG TPA: O-antigen ligase family protein [Bacillota bacterium]|nr:O-antigen ligase family protein [Bacillota bacterium]
MKKNWMERFTGLTLAFNPVCNVIGVIWLSFKVKHLPAKIKSDRVSLILWILIAISGIFTVIVAKDKAAALSGYLIPFAIVWFYILGKWVIKDPVTFIQDMIRGVAVLSIIVVVAQLFNINWVIGNVRILYDFSPSGRGEVFYVGNNILGIMIQAGVVGAVGSFFVNWKTKRFLVGNIITVIVGACALIVTDSKGAMLGTVAGVLFLVICYGVVALISAGLLAGVWLLFSKRLHILISTGVNGSEWVRMEIWRATFRMIKDHLFFGIGAGQYVKEFQKYRPKSLMGTEYNNVCTCGHSNYLSYIAAYGIVGAILFFGWQFFILLRALIGGLTPLQRVIMAILISFFVHVLVNDLVVAYWGILLGLLENPYFKTNQSVSLQGEEEVSS